ncbi:tail protein [Streptomyces phage phiSASD1]|uniref:Gp31 n=1 Tax=Streptomyces phage phiSASD1 TaxID=747763 RepID=D7NW57_9CAUD|nr:tail protein [Streptomyces phage phiSASD1]ADE43455.1 gp31 [Streptomyces phage phiSASD1]
MAALSATRIATSGTSPTYVPASAGGDSAPVGGGLKLHVSNGSGSAVTVTLVTPGTLDGLAIGDAALVVPAGGHGFVPLTQIYRDPITGRANITYSAVTSVNVAVLSD